MPPFDDVRQAGLSPGEPPVKNSSTKKKGDKGHRITDEQWNNEVEAFRQVVENAGAFDGAIRPAWKKLRQNYAQKFNATIACTSVSSTSLEPFPLWAAETFDEDILNRVLRVEFSDQLAQCDFLTLIRSTAAMADISMWHMILYFGTSIFSASRVKTLRKRKHMFKRDADGTTWPFTAAYKNMLRQTAVKQSSSLNSTKIPCSDTSPIFTSSEFNYMAPSNPEFQLAPQEEGKKAQKGITGIPFGTANGKEGKKEDQEEDYKGKGKERKVTGVEQADALALPPGLAPRRERGQSHDHHDHRHYHGQNWYQGQDGPSLETAKDQEDSRQKELVDHDQPVGPASWASAYEKLALDTLVPSIELLEQFEETNVGPSRTIRALTAGTHAGGKGNLLRKSRPTRARGLVRQLNKCVATQGISEDHDVNVFTFQREASLIPTVFGTHLSLKRLIKEENGEAGPLKRSQIEKSRRTAASAGIQNFPTQAFEGFSEWTDTVILDILRKIEAVRSEEVVVVNGMKSYSAIDYPSALPATDVRKGTILLPLKLSDSYRVLAVLHLNAGNPNDAAVENPNQGTILYYDPTDSNTHEFLRGYQLASRVAQLLGYFLPGYNADPGAWDIQYCAMPKQQTRGDTGVAVCLAAMFVVGSLPHMAQIPEGTDWTFWRHFVLSCFYGSDEFVRAQNDNYRFQTIQTLIRQGQVRGRTPDYRCESDDEIQCTGHTTRDPVQRMVHREINAQKLLQLAHQGHIVCLNLMSHVHRSMTSLKIKLDKSRLVQNRPGSNAYRVKGNIKEKNVTEEVSNFLLPGPDVSEFTFKQYKDRQLSLDEAAGYLRLAIDQATVWRLDIQQAVMEMDENVA